MNPPYGDAVHEAEWLTADAFDVHMDHEVDLEAEMAAE